MIEPAVTAGTSRSGRVRTMSRRMAESTSQRDFYGTSSMHYMANPSTTAFDETLEDLFHDKPIGPTARKSVQGCLLYHL
jgi:hypothetical protein